MAAPVAKSKGGLMKNRRALIAFAALAVIGLFYLRSRSAAPAATSTTAATNDPNAAAGGSVGGGGSTSTALPTGDQIPISAGDNTSVAAALEGLASGLGFLQTRQANNEAQVQSAAEANARTAQAYDQVNTLAGSVAGALGQLVGYVTTTAATPTEPPVQPPPPPTPGPASARTSSSPPAATPPTEPFGGIVSVVTLANGAKLTTYGSGRKVEQAPGKPPYVVHA